MMAAIQQLKSLAALEQYLFGVKVPRGIEEIVLHHSWRPMARQYAGKKTWDGIRAYHINNRGWSDTGYHFGVGPDSSLWRLRPVERSGAHVLNRNEHTVGVCMIGDYDVEDPAKVLPVAAQVVRALCSRFNLGAGAIHFHSEFQAKTCPGTRCDLADFRRLVFRGAADAPDPAPRPALTLQIDGHPHPEVRPWIDGGISYAPLAPLARALGATVEYDAQGNAILVRTAAREQPAAPTGTVIIPQAWVEGFEHVADEWWRQLRVYRLTGDNNVSFYCVDVAEEVGVSEKLLLTRMQLEQSALTYAWDGSSTDYAGGDAYKLRYLCGVDRTDSGDRAGGWFGPEQQLLGCALRFKHWYRGRDGGQPGWENWLGFTDNGPQAGVPYTDSTGATIIPANQASADCLMYTPNVAAALRLREIGLRWWPEDYAKEEGANDAGA